MSKPSANDLYHAAQRYIAQGQPVFPCSARGAQAKRPVGSLVPHGFKDATLDKNVVKGWIKTLGDDLALGLATGVLWDVLDVDIKDSADGRKHLTRLNTLGLLNGCQRVVRTPSGGWHLYFNTALGITSKARSATLGLDVRGLGGYVLAPPSFLVDAGDNKVTGPYEDHGVPDKSMLDESEHDAPLYWDLIVKELSPVNNDTGEPMRLLPSERQASVASLREFVANLQVGERNNGFFWAVNRCIENGIDPNEMAEPASLIGLSDDEVSKSIDSALTRAGVRVEQLDSEAEALFPDTAA